MYLYKWLERKYPELYLKILGDLREEMIYDLKNKGFKLGYSKKDITNWDGKIAHEKENLLIYRKTNPVNDYNYPLCYVNFKVPKVYDLESGIAGGLYVTNSDIIEV